VPPAADTPERVVAAAPELLAREGYAGLTLNALAPRAGAAKTTIRRRWRSNAAVAVAAAECLALHSVERPESGTLRGDLNALQRKVVAVLTEGDGGFVSRLIRESGHHPEIANLPPSCRCAPPTPALAELHAGGDLDGDDRGDDPVDDHAERRPPARAGDEVAAVLPEVLESVAGQAGDEQPR